VCVCVCVCLTERESITAAKNIYEMCLGKANNSVFGFARSVSVPVK